MSLQGENFKDVAEMQAPDDQDVPFVPLYNLADLYGVAKNVIWKARPDEKIFAWNIKVG
jgi:hypothetical protein